MPAIRLDWPKDDDARRKALYDGDILLFSERDSVRRFCDHAQSASEEAFAPHDPTTAQFEVDVERCDPETTYFDVPRIRTMAHGDYLRAGLALQFHPHRDTWFSAPFQQLNWWLPVYPIEPTNTMSFHFEHWARPIRNSSRIYDYERWKQTGRKAAAKQVGKETRKQPEPEEPVDPALGVPISCDVGGLIVFSAAQLHGTVENTSGYTRFSIDFRTVNLDDLEAGLGAPNLDSECTGTTLGDFLRVSDLAPIPEDIQARYAA